MVVINKMDQWHDDLPDVRKYYETGKIKELIDRVAKNTCRTDSKASFHTLSCSYNSFKGKAPSGGFSKDASILSKIMLKAEIETRLKEIN